MTGAPVERALFCCDGRTARCASRCRSSSREQMEHMLGQLKTQLAGKDSRLQQAEEEAVRLQQALETTRSELEAALRSDGRTLLHKGENANENDGGKTQSRVGRGTGMVSTKSLPKHRHIYGQ